MLYSGCFAYHMYCALSWCDFCSCFLTLSPFHVLYTFSRLVVEHNIHEVSTYSLCHVSAFGSSNSTIRFRWFPCETVADPDISLCVADFVVIVLLRKVWQDSQGQAVPHVLARRARIAAAGEEAAAIPGKDGDGHDNGNHSLLWDFLFSYHSHYFQIFMVADKSVFSDFRSCEEIIMLRFRESHECQCARMCGAHHYIGFLRVRTGSNMIFFAELYSVTFLCTAGRYGYA